MIAQALLRTENIRLCPGAYMLPFHHPAELAHRIAWLDHISRGRCYIGIGASGVTTDWAMFGIDGMAGENREMAEESLEIMRLFWESEEPFEYQGKFWSVKRPEDAIDHAVGITGLVDIGVKLEKDDPVATIHARDEKALETARKRVLAAYEIAENAPDVAEPIAERILG